MSIPTPAHGLGVGGRYREIGLPGQVIDQPGEIAVGEPPVIGLAGAPIEDLPAWGSDSFGEPTLTVPVFEERLARLLAQGNHCLGSTCGLVTGFHGDVLYPVAMVGISSPAPSADAVFESAFGNRLRRCDGVLEVEIPPGDRVHPDLGWGLGIRVCFAGRLIGLLAFFAPSRPALRDPQELLGMLTGLSHWAASELAFRITEHHRDRVLRHLHQGHTTMVHAIKGAPLPIAMLDRDLRYIAHSQSWLIEHRLEPEDLEGIGHFDAYPQSLAVWDDALRRALEGVTVSEEEAFFPHADGTPRYLRWLMQPWFGPHQTIAGVMILTEDRTDQVMAREKLIEASRAKSSFLATISHEIRTPMNGVIGMLELLRRTRLDERQHYFVSAIDTSSQALLVLLNDILDFARIEAGTLQLQHVEFNLRLLLQDIVSLLAPKAEAKRISLVLTCPETLPTRVLGDPGRLRQVIINLVDNAVKFTHRGGVTIGVECLMDSKTQARFRISVRDTGEGIPPDQLGVLFRAFSQLDSRTTRRGGGTGLGLAICKQLVELAGGEIGVDSTLGAGSRFWLEIPLAKQDVQSTDMPARATAMARKAEIQRPLGLRVLVAEDNPINQTVAREYLRLLGCTAIIAENGEEALQRCREQNFDVVLMDCHMPTMDGFQATRMIRSLPNAKGRVPVYAMTASVSPQDQEDCLKAGMNGHFAKPIQIDDLHRMLSSLQASRTFINMTTPYMAAYASHESVAHIDQRRLELITGGSVELRRTLLRISQKELSQRVGELNLQVGAGDLEQAANTTHRLKGGAENIGANHLGAAAKRLEDAVRAGRLNEARTLILDVLNAHEHTQAEIAILLE